MIILRMGHSNSKNKIKAPDGDLLKLNYIIITNLFFIF
jgi:hypothetical protein